MTHHLRNAVLDIHKNHIKESNWVIHTLEKKKIQMLLLHHKHWYKGAVHPNGCIPAGKYSDNS